MKLRKEHLKTPEGTAVIAALIFGIITHLFGLVNVIHNYDDIASQPGGYGSGISLGRWLLGIIGRFAETCGFNYNLPVINGLVFIGLIAVSVGFLVSVFQIKNRMSAALMGMLFAAFPTATSTLFFRYTAPFYGISLLFAVLAAWVMPRYKYGFALSVLCITVSLGIYQAYVPITISIFVLLLIRQALEGESGPWKLVRRGLCDCAALVLGLLLYYLGLQIALASSGGSLTDYRGLSNMGQIALGDVPGLVWQAFDSFCSIPFQDYCGVAHRKSIQVSYLLLGGITVVMIGYILIAKVKKVSIAVITCLLCLVFPVAVNFIVVMCPDNWIYTLMVYSFALVACVPLVLLECLPPMEGKRSRGKHILTRSVGLLTAFLVFCYAYYANVNYTALYYANRQVENYVNSIVVQVRMTEGFDSEKEWAFIGNIEDPLLSCAWEEETTYGGSGFTEYLLNQYSRPDWIRNYIGYDVPEASSETVAELSANEEVRNMPCWPDAGSIQVVDDTVVIKFQDLTS